MTHTDTLTPWWVIPGRLAGMRKPQTHELGTLAKSRFQAVVSLLDSEDNHQLYHNWQLPYLWLPTEDGQTVSPQQLQQLEQFIDRFDGAVAIHCNDGRKRTVSAIAAYLIRKEHDFEQALKMASKGQPRIELEEDQLLSLLQMAKVVQ
ncbi:MULTISPECIES: dual specificity protein phosphatase family protein [Ferrimonas]|uniref:protein-tyrosine phosphatase family protein n=1 Tax=Ferrimonas TaxID=44011 RepID=UPI0003F52715|nr:MULTISPECIES: dual specificity protein phosphatase family protein [Ferrimonas]USD39337.1 dual specificity protein phosphatase family protein [Ferrimonas sp. SCSIO 43195]